MVKCLLALKAIKTGRRKKRQTMRFSEGKTRRDCELRVDGSAILSPLFATADDGVAYDYALLHCYCFVFISFSPSFFPSA